MKRGLFSGMDEESFAKIKKMLVDDQREKRKKKHKNKRKGRVDHRTNRPGKRK
jgi:hypothetical protein|tara:strand:+ start:800 stop:958 length:159 start_codon:yes stop_codon:yes gene_type:complete